MNRIDRYLIKRATFNGYRIQILWFRTLIYILLLGHFLLLLGAYDVFFSKESLTGQLEYTQGTLDYFTHLTAYHANLDAIYALLFIAYAISLCLGIFNKFPGLIKYLIFFLTVNVFNSVREIHSGGHNLVQILLWFNLFFSTRPKANEVEVLFSNFSVLAARLQIVFMYAASLWFKTQGTYWLDGTAIGMVLVDPIYSIARWSTLLLTYPILIKVSTYMVLLYHILFVLFIWVEKVKHYLLYAGIFFHCYIAFVVGLPDFGLFTLAGYALFWKRRVNVLSDQKLPEQNKE